MNIIATTTHPVYRHRQDTGASCGRACAQMIISSLSQAGSAANTPIAVAQETLRTRETNPIDIELWWFTEPAELCGLLANAPELAATDRDWRVAAHSTADKLLADLILSMQAHGRPAAVTIGANEHWVVLTTVRKEGTHQVFEFLNPLPSDLVHAGPFQHRYQDPDCGLDQQQMAVVNTGNELADLNLKIKGFPKPTKIHVVSPPGEVKPGAKLPPTSSVGTLANKAVGVTFGPKPALTAINQLAREIKSSRLKQTRLMATNPVEVVRSGLRTQLRAFTSSFDIRPVQRVLTAPDLAIRATRVIQDVQQANLKYVLASGFSQQAKAGFIAAFDSSVNGELLHVQVTRDEALIRSLARAAGETLYWTSAQTSHFPPMALPYYVFRRKPGHPKRLIRLYDDVEGEVMTSPLRSPGPGREPLCLRSGPTRQAPQGRAPGPVVAAGPRGDRQGAGHRRRPDPARRGRPDRAGRAHRA